MIGIQSIRIRMLLRFNLILAQQTPRMFCVILRLPSFFLYTR